MPGPYWTSKRGSWDVQLGIEWGAFEVSGDGSQARITGGKVWRNSSANISDSSNNLAVSGGAVVDSSGSESTSGSGKKLLRNVTGQWQTLTHGSPSTANFTASWSDVEAAGSTMTITRTIEYPARAYAAPAAPTGLSISGSGTSRTLTWANTSPGSTSAPYQGIVIGRRVNDGAWTNVAQIGVVTTFTNTAVPVNAKVEYRVAAFNGSTVVDSSGPPQQQQSAWSYAAAGAVYTKPATPTMGTAGKLANGDIRLTWTDQSNWNTVFDIQDSPNGSSWSTVASPADAAGVAAESWDHSSPDAGVSHRYRVRARLADGQTSDWSATSNIVQLLAAPNPPSNLAPSGTAADPADPITLTYLHNPVDSTPQTQREVQVRIDGGSWSSLGADTTASQSKTIAGGTWSAPASVEWQVRTKGAHASWSGWSATATISLTPKPVATIVTPTGTINASRVTPQVDYYDAGGHAQSSTTVTVWRDGVLLETSVATGNAPLPQLATVFADGGEYVFQASVTSSVGLKSSTASETIDVSYLPPATPTAAWVWDRATGSVGISTSNPEGQAAVEVRRNRALDPRAASANAQGVGRWTAGSALGTYSSVTGISGPVDTGIDTAKRVTLTSSASDTYGWQVIGDTTVGTPTGANMLAVTPGEPVTVSTYAKWVTAATAAISGLIRVRYSADGTTWQAAASTASTTPMTAGQWDRLSATLTPPAGAAFMAVGFYSTGPADRASGDTLEATGLLIEDGPDLGAYLDGEHSPDAALTASWVGTVDLSESTLHTKATADTVTQELWRIVDGQATLLIDDLEPNGSVSDDTPTTTGQRYRLVAVSADGATTSTEFEVPPDPAVVRWWWMSADGHVARLRYRPTRSRASSLAQDVAHYAGRVESVVTYGEAVTRTAELGGVLILDEGTDWAAFEQVALAAEPAVVRGPDGSRFRAAVASTGATDSNDRRQEVTVGLIRVGDEQAPLEPVELI